MEDDIRPINVNQYNSDEGKLIASIKWLITRIYEDNGIPDKLRELFYRDDEGNLNLTTAVAAALTNGSLYSQAASRILRDPGLVNQSHGTVLRALSRSVEIEVRDSDGALVTEMALISTDPIRLTTHLALIDALMTAHMKSIITIDKVVTAVSEYTMVEKREEPMDCIDSLLFWINKICLLVRDDVERNDILLKGGTENITIPEMEDLYEDLCDGTCITALISFYRPHEIQLSDICFNDPISLQDCRYNLGLLKNFCEICLPWNPFHFEIDDILYLHESLQPNVNAFLADLFYFFEPSQSESEQLLQQQQIQSPTQRRFIPINAIPELRAQNLANRPVHPPKVRNHHLAVDRNRTLSLSSQDSLMTSKSGERQNNNYRPTTLPPGAPTMSFGALGGTDLSSPNGYSESNGADQNNKSDSANLTAIRLALHQRRQEYEQKQYMENSATEAERQKAGKDAFFKLMKTGQDQQQQQRVRAQSEMAAAQTMIPPHQQHQQQSGLLPSTMMHGNEQQQQQQQLISSSGPTREEVLSAQVQSLQEQIQNMAMTNAMSRPPTGMSHAISQPSIHNDLMYPGTSPMYRPQMQHDPHQMYAMPYGYPPHQQPQQPPPPSIYDQQPYAMPHQPPPPPPQASYYSPMRYGGTLPHNSGMSYSMYEPQQQFQTSISPQNHHLYGGQSFDDYHQHHIQQQQQQPSTIPNANNTFHLHQANASNSRLDPPLELNRNLTNWGLTYRAQTRTPRKTWAEFKSEHDLRNPDTSNSQGYPHEQQPKSQAFEIQSSIQQQQQQQQQQQHSPPRDPDLRPLQSSQSTIAMHETTPIRRRPSTPKYENGNGSTEKPAAGFTIKDTPAAVDMTPEMQAKRNALYANLMKRKEKIADKVEEKEAQYSEKREAERAKQEAAEQRKLETEFRRQKLLEEYKRKKLEKEFPELAGTSSPTMSARSNSNLQRGHSQPPFVQMGKSQSNMHEIHARSTPRTSRAKSNAGDENSTPRLHIPSTAEPSLKLFAKHVPKSNRSLIVNALQYSIFPGAVSSDQRNKVQEALAQSDSKHFLLLFRDHKCQYRGLYTWDGASDTAHKIHGMGPKIVKEEMMSMMFKYDSGSKHFNKIPAKHLSPTIDGFLIHDQLWQKPKIPHSGAR